MMDRNESIFFKDGGHVDFNHIDNRTFYRIIRHEFIGSHPSNPDIQNVDRTYAEGLVIDLVNFKKEMEKCDDLKSAMNYINNNKLNSLDSIYDSVFTKKIK